MAGAQRGSYKRYLIDDEDVEIPESTRRYRRMRLGAQLEDIQSEPDNSEESELEDGFNIEVDSNNSSIVENSASANENTDSEDELNIFEDANELYTEESSVTSSDDEHYEIAEEDDDVESISDSREDDEYEEHLSEISENSDFAELNELFVDFNDPNLAEDMEIIDDDVNLPEDRVTLYEECDHTEQKSELILMTFALRHRLPDVGLENMINLIDSYLPYPVHKSKYRFLKSFPQPAIETYYLCGECDIDVDFSSGNKARCSVCDQEWEKCFLIKEKRYFFYLPLEQQLKEVVNSEVYRHFRKECNESDVVNGEVYQKLRQRNIIADKDLTIQWFTDGVKLNKSTIKSAWPNFIMINELPYRLRKENILLCGLWFADKKPPMNVFLKPFIEELENLQRNGFQTTTLFDREPVAIKVHALLAPVDSVARPSIQNLTQYNGTFGCTFCLAKGKNVPVGRGTGRVYCGDVGAPRNLRQHDVDAEKAVTQGKSVRGVKGISVVRLLPVHHLIFSFPPEYLHSVAEGAIKLLVTEWFNSKNHEKSWYLGRVIDSFDKMLTKMKPSCEITRTPSPVKQHSTWKASEWKNFLLYYSLVLLSAFMPNKYAKHWLLLVYSINTFLKPKISESEFEKAEAALRKFVLSVEGLYGPEYMKYNIHLLLHIPQAVKKFGALWAWSTFPFESYNGVMGSLFHGTQCIPEQICKFYTRLRYINKSSDIFSRPNCSEKGKRMFQTLMKECGVQRCLKYGESLRVFGVPGPKMVTRIEKLVIEDILQKEIKDETQVFQRFVFRKIKFHGRYCPKMVKRNNSVIQTENGRLMIISYLLNVTLRETDTCQQVLIGQELEMQNEVLCKNGNVSTSDFSFIAKETNNIVGCLVSDIKTKCVCIEYGENKLHIIPVVNNLETD